jgi:glycosyltransferase involved in cell wall biosynthesis
MKIVWLRPSTGENVSVRRERIAEHLEEMGVKVTICDASGTDAVSAVAEVAKGNYDVIIGNVRIGLYLGYILSVALRKPLIGDVSDSIEDVSHLPGPVFKSLRAFEWWILDRAEACFFVETRSYNVAENRGLNPILARNSVDYDRFSDPSQESKKEARRILEKHQIPLDKPMIIYIGSMVPEYHFSEIGEAAKKTPGWEFVFVGEERGAGLADMISDTDNAHFLGSYDYGLMPGFLYHADAGMCLADKEQPLKVMEYGAAGLPTLGYDGKLRKNFSEEELVFVGSDPEEISSVLSDLSDPERAEEYGENLRQRAKEDSWRSVAEKYYEQITNALEKE